MREIGTLEAKDQFGQLFNDVEHGEEVIITRQGGEEIACLVPTAKRTIDKVTARAAVQLIRAKRNKKALAHLIGWNGRHSARMVGTNSRQS